MCIMTVTEQAFTPTGVATTVLDQYTSMNATVVLPTNSTNTPAATKLRITTTGGGMLYFTLGDSSIVAVVGTSSILLSNDNRTVGIGANAYVGLLNGTAATEAVVTLETGY